jgi:GNAT superfamily N-acetyltransferase
MSIEIVEQSEAVLPEYSRVPIAFRVESRFRIEVLQRGLGGLLFVEEAVTPYVKDYDAITGEGPSHWLKRWDLSTWGFLCAFDDSRLIGGAALAWRTPGLNDLEGRDDLAVLWDLRVHPDYRGQGVGHRLFTRTTAWASERQCNGLKVETQNINVPACRFYARQGCELGAINRYAYDEAMDEIQMIWYRRT